VRMMLSVRWVEWQTLLGPGKPTKYAFTTVRSFYGFLALQGKGTQTEVCAT